MPMDWLNYHHLRYFWVVAKEGSLRQAALKLSVSEPAISAQLQDLANSLGEPLFRRSGRNLVLTETGHMVLGYAEEIFSVGQELLNAVRQMPTTRVLRVNLGVVDSFPKLVTLEFLKPLFDFSPRPHLICHEGKAEDLLPRLEPTDWTSCSPINPLPPVPSSRPTVICWEPAPSASAPYRVSPNLSRVRSRAVWMELNASCQPKTPTSDAHSRIGFINRRSVQK